MFTDPPSFVDCRSGPKVRADTQRTTTVSPCLAQWSGPLTAAAEPESTDHPETRDHRPRSGAREMERNASESSKFEVSVDDGPRGRVAFVPAPPPGRSLPAQDPKLPIRRAG